MPIHLDNSSEDFAPRFAAFLATKREGAADVEEAARAIIAGVAARGDEALLAYTHKFDRIGLKPSELRITPAEIDDGFGSCDRAARDALALACQRIEAYHRRQMPRDERFTDSLGGALGWRWTAIAAVGLYVPGGTAAYPSSVLMNAV